MANFEGDFMESFVSKLVFKESKFYSTLLFGMILQSQFHAFLSGFSIFLPQILVNFFHGIIWHNLFYKYSHDFFVKITNMAKLFADFNILANVTRQKVVIGTHFQRRIFDISSTILVKFFHGIVWHTLFYN